MTAIIPTSAPHRFSEDLNFTQYAANRMQPLDCSAAVLRIFDAYSFFKLENDLLLQLLRLLSE